MNISERNTKYYQQIFAKSLLYIEQIDKEPKLKHIQRYLNNQKLYTATGKKWCMNTLRNVWAQVYYGDSTMMFDRQVRWRLEKVLAHLSSIGYLTTEDIVDRKSYNRAIFAPAFRKLTARGGNLRLNDLAAYFNEKKLRTWIDEEWTRDTVNNALRRLDWRKQIRGVVKFKFLPEARFSSGDLSLHIADGQWYLYHHTEDANVIMAFQWADLKDLYSILNQFIMEVPHGKATK